jgi:hypothetical protein
MLAIGVYAIAIVRELFYDSNLAKISGGRKPGGHHKEVTALLHFENRNPHHPNSVRVEIEGRTVGHLSHSDAKAHRRIMETRGKSGASARCAALITGGQLRTPDKRETNFDVRLDLGKKP